MLLLRKDWLADDAVHHKRFLTDFVLIIYEVFSLCVFLCHVIITLPVFCIALGDAFASQPLGYSLHPEFCCLSV